MPYIRIDWVEGRDSEQRRRIVDEFTKTMLSVCGCSEDHVWITFNDVKGSDWAIGGKFFSDKA